MSLRRVWVGWSVLAMVLALVLAPALGLVHGVLHGDRVHHTHQHTHHADVHSHDDHAAGLEQLFADHSEATDCRVYDQQSHADLAPGIPMLVLPHVPIGFTLRHQAGEALARFAALFEARGPPLGA